MSEDYRGTIDKEVRYYKALEQAEQIIPEWIEAGLTYEELRVLLRTFFNLKYSNIERIQ
tara:strand:- start:1224 stop:1400 length:177 start_codon:yes stop_codon:yes gene_type:complete